MLFQLRRKLNFHLCYIQKLESSLLGPLIKLWRKGIDMIENESAENYLETILMLSKKLPVVRSVDIANELGFKKSSVSIAMKNLREKKHITVTNSGFIYLTESGKNIAELVLERHEFISKWLINLGVPSNIATEDACKIEHILSKESYDAIKGFVQQHL